MPPTQPGPEFSIVLPVGDPPLDLTPCLDSLARLQGPSLEVLLVLHGRGQDLAQVRAQAAAAGVRVQVLALAPGPAGAARNFGAEQARGRILLFSQPECRLPPELLRGLAAHLADPGVAGVGGSCWPANPDQPLARLQGLEIA